MKKSLLRSSIILLVISSAILATLTGKKLYKKQVEPIIRLTDLNESELVSEASENPQMRAQEEFDMLKDPKTGKIPENIRLMELQNKRLSQSTNWIFKAIFYPLLTQEVSNVLNINLICSNGNGLWIAKMRVKK